ncbi:hypothetical protein AHAS_Ahas20G0032400 [Arachis hypogaea]
MTLPVIATLFSFFRRSLFLHCCFLLLFSATSKEEVFPLLVPTTPPFKTCSALALIFSSC